MRTLFTGADNASLDIGRVLWAVIVGHYCILSGYALFAMHAPFDPVVWSAGAAAVLAGGGGALALKLRTEPAAQQ